MDKPHQDTCTRLAATIAAGWFEENLLDRRQVLVRAVQKKARGRQKGPLLRIAFCPMCGEKINPDARRSGQ